MSTHHWSSRVAAAGAIALLAAAVGAIDPGTSHAQTCGAAGINCPSLLKESTLSVDHVRIAQDLPYYIEPVTGETWDATVTWASDASQVMCPCTTTTANVNFSVNWNAGLGTFVATCNSGCSATGPIRGVTICATGGCASGLTVHGWQYNVVLDLASSVAICGSEIAYLDSVAYASTSVNNGTGIVGQCATAGTYTPTRQVWTATDTGPFQCTGTCLAGPSITITYQ
jgi:hypothetical protein